MKQLAILGMVAAIPVAAFADPVPWVGDTIVIENEGTYTLDSDASASGIYFDAEATLNGSSTLTITSPAVVYGSGTIETPLAGTDGICITNAWASSRTVYPQKNTWTTIWTGAKLAIIDDITAALYGTYIRVNISGSYYRIYWPAKTVAFAKSVDGTTATAQFHMMNQAGQPRAIKVAFQQNGNDVEAQLVWAKYTSDSSKFGLDWDATSGLSTYGDATFNENSICVTDFHGRTSPLVLRTSSLPSGAVSFNAGEVVVEPTADMTITSSLSGIAERIVFRGSKTAVDDAGPLVTLSPTADNALSQRPSIVFDGIDARLTNRAIYTLPAYYEVVLTNNAVLADVAAYNDRSLFMGGEFWPYGSGAGNSSITNAIVITRGCKVISATGDWDFKDPVVVVVAGGVLDFGARNHYLNNLTLSDGGQVSGSFVVGYFASEMRLTTRGESMCTISGSIKMNNPKSAGKSYVFELGCDLTVSGGIKQQGSSSVCDILKKGPAKLVVGNDTSLKGAPGAVCVEDGCVQLAANDAFSRTNAITLAGGSIDTGSSTNRLGVLTLAANSSIAVGAGQLTFSDSSSAAWESGATLSITGAAEKLKAGQVRFLSDGGSGLAGAQLNSIRYNGGGVVIDGDGWLRSTSGLMMIVR